MMQKEQFYKLTETPALLNMETLAELQNLTTEYPFFQAAWFLYLKNLKKTDAPGFDNALKRAAIAISDRKQLYGFLNSKNSSYTGSYYFGDDTTALPGSSGKPNEQQESSLIDKFLINRSGHIKVGKPTGEEHSETTENEITAKSATENNDLVTETLAEIYFEQKKYDKAVEAFKKLSLKYPEKSIYFATRIREAEKLKNI